ncbi:choice-of-anchor J domain-containing protein [Flavobacterium sp.]|uniref:choice-of-anchor J domain-containing protein n=1 Tax=Flavobacterium sp. TaxID=239 RepID=UPI0025F2A2B1|nr:choice-of-anchor J domain-containing protein [Flavobacterium sp.]
MKTIQFKVVLLVSMIASMLSSCTKDSDVEVPSAKTTLFAENFDNTDLTATGWIRYAQTGTKLWTQGSYKNNGYAKFSSYSSGQPVNVTWLISPPIDMDAQVGEKLFFQSCQDGYVRSIDNSLELYVSTDYDGITFDNASWVKIPFDYPTQNTIKYVYVNSGIIDLSTYTGTLHFAFKVKGTSSLTGGYQVDNVRVFY